MYLRNWGVTCVVDVSGKTPPTGDDESSATPCCQSLQSFDSGILRVSPELIFLTISTSEDPITNQEQQTHKTRITQRQILNKHHSKNTNLT